MIEKEEIGVGILGQANLRRGHVREQRHRNAIVLPAQRLAERAQEPHRSLPAVAAHVRDVHRGRAVLQHDDVDTGGAHQRGDGLRPGQGQERRGGGEDQEEPEQQLAKERDALVDRHLAAAHERPRVGAPLPQLPTPQQQQRRRDGEQRQKSGSAEPHYFKTSGPQVLRT
jgi:hypothetical protein